LVELIRKEIKKLEENGWIVHFTWVKAHDNNNIGTNLLIGWRMRRPATTTYSKYPKSAETSELKGFGLQKWQSEGGNRNKRA
jgi:hypothetical protein